MQRILPPIMFGLAGIILLNAGYLLYRAFKKVCETEGNYSSMDYPSRINTSSLA